MDARKLTYGFPAELARLEPATTPLRHRLREGLGYRAGTGFLAPITETGSAAPSISMGSLSSSKISSLEPPHLTFALSSPQSSLATKRPARNRFGALIAAAGSKVLALVAPSSKTGVRVRPPAGCCR